MITWKEMQRRGRSAFREDRRGAGRLARESPQGLRLQSPRGGTEGVHTVREETGRPEALRSLVLF